MGVPNQLLPVLFKKTDQIGGQLTTGETVSEGTVVRITGFGKQKSRFTGDYFYPEPVVSNLKAADVATSGVNIFADLDATFAGDVAISGTGILEAYAICGIAFRDAPVQDSYLTTGNPGDVTGYVAASKYGSWDIRRVTFLTAGLCWVSFSGTLTDVVAGDYAVPSSGVDGYVSRGSDGAIELVIGKIMGVSSGATYSINPSSPVVVPDKVLVKLQLGRW